MALVRLTSNIQESWFDCTDSETDIDWEYPGGNGADYKEAPNSEKTYEIEAFPKILAATKRAIGKDKILSIAVPGKKGDMIGFTKETGPQIWPSVDQINVSAFQASLQKVCTGLT